MSIWRLHTSTSGCDISDYCLKNNVIAMGWSLREISDTERSSIHSFEEYCNFADSVYDNYSSVSRVAEEIKQNDLIWMRHNGNYYIARVTNKSKWIFNNDEESQLRDVCNQVTNIHWYPVSENADEDSVPGAIATAFIQGAAFQRIRKSAVETYSQMIYNRTHDYKADNYSYIFSDLKLNKENFYSLLHPDDVEDLLCLWLYKEKNYICIPSTNKKATQKYECVLLCPGTGKHIYIQAKNGSIDLNADDYSNLNGEVYLISTFGNVTNTDKYDNIFSVSSDTIFDFATDNQNNNILPESVKNWVQFLREPKGIMFDTNIKKGIEHENSMLMNQQICAYGNSKKFIKSFSQEDYVLYYSCGKGIIGIGKITSDEPRECENGLYHSVKLIVPTNADDFDTENISIKPDEIKKILNRNFYWASTIKTPFLKKCQVDLLIKELEKKYNNK